MGNTKYAFISWREIGKTAKLVAQKLKKACFRPDIIVAIARGGIVPARLLCDHLYLKNLVAMKVDHWGITATIDGKAKIAYGINIDISGKKILLVDDVTDTGQSMDLAKKYLVKLGPKVVKTAALYHLATSRYTPNFYGQEREWAWLIFPWNRWEDLVNISKKVLNGKREKTVTLLKDGLEQELGVKVNLRQAGEILEHLNFLDGG